MAKCVVYTVTHIESRRVYIGFTSQDIGVRWSAHRTKCTKGECPYFHAALQKYGSNAFEWRVHSEYESKELGLRGEAELIKQLRSQSVELFNLSAGGEAPSPTMETRKKLSLALKGKTVSERTRARLSASASGNVNGAGNRGRVLSMETRERIAIAKRGHAASEASRKKVSETLKRRYVNDPEARRQRSEAVRKAWKTRRRNAT